MLYIFIFLLISITMSFYMLKNKRYMKTSEMAIVMGLGITMHGVLPYHIGTSFYQSVFAQLFLAIILAIWISFIFSILISQRHGKFIQIHSFNPINRFGIGTWIAGTSICGVLIVTNLPQLAAVSKIIVLVNIVLWFYFISISAKGFRDLYRNQINALKDSHGIFLLTTVSTQSIVVSLHYIFKGTPEIILITLMLLGIGFYLMGAFLIIKRYATITWSFENDWQNTNCILHGALSITGLAAVLSGIVDQKLIMLLWICTVLVFLLVELIEIYRLHGRINMYGFRIGIFVYDVSQWSRVFTFSMLYTFTSYIRSASEVLSFIQSSILQLGLWVVGFLILLEVVLMVKKQRDKVTSAVSLNLEEYKSL